jgi:ribosomal protein S18 acetylase RimI-like enzyme
VWGSELKRDFIIRGKVQNDKDSLEEIIGLSFPRFFRFFASRSLNSEGTVVVSEAKRRVVGFAKLTEFNVGGGGFGCVLWLAVHPDFRRQNVGAELVEAGTNHLLSHQAGAVFASTQRRNSASLATFRKTGYRRVGFLGLWRIFGWRVFSLYRKMWYAPGEIVLMHDNAEKEVFVF